MSSGENFLLRWNQFHMNIKMTYQEVHETGDYADITLACEDGEVKAHRIILSSSSLFFKDKVASLANSHPLVYLRGVKLQELSNIMDFIYQGEAEVRKEDLEAFLAIARELGVKGLTEQVKNTQEETVVEELVEEVKDNMVKEKEVEEDIVKEKEVMGKEVEENIVKENIVKENKVKEKVRKNMVKVLISEPTEKQESTTSTEDKAVKVERFEERNIDDSVLSEVEALYNSNATDNFELEEKINNLVEKRNGMWTCNMCGKFNNSRFSLSRHVETHIDGFSHPCPWCEKTFSTRDALRTHRGRTHPGETAERQLLKPFNCDICAKPSESMRAVKVHKRRNHRSVL